MHHALMYHGGFDRNFPELKSGAKTFAGSDGSERVLGECPTECDGLRVGYMEKDGKNFVAVRVTDDDGDVILQHPVLIDITRHLGLGRRFSAEPTVFVDDTAKTLLDDIIIANPDQRAELLSIRERMPWGTRKRP
ncbi:MAG: hypothetical protein ABI877_20880 [Gemmatimonadaceae bacterium]